MDAVAILKIHRLKKTSPRIAIIQALQTSQNPLSESEVKEKMGQLFDRVTFYRSVLTLEKTGIIHRIVADNTLVKYALNHGEKGCGCNTNHIHFYCTKCNMLVCFKEVKTHQYKLPHGFSFNQCDVLIKGLCNECNNIVGMGKQ
jgi:Fur family transcriptional regulator, ferric uptake regulator